MFQGCYKAGKGLRLIISTAGLMDGTLMAAYCLSLDMSGRRMADEKMLRRLPKLILNVQVGSLGNDYSQVRPRSKVSHDPYTQLCQSRPPHAENFPTLSIPDTEACYRSQKNNGG